MPAKKNPLKDVRKALGIKEEASEPDEEEAESAPAEAEASTEAEQEKEEEPKQAAPKEDVPQASKPVPPIPIDEILEKMKLLPIVIRAKFIPEIHYFLVVPVKDDEHKLLLGYTMGEKTQC